MGKVSFDVPFKAPSIPTIQASLFAVVSPNCVVPVLAAESRPPARLWPRE
ncbi:Uncharacterised protein [Mycobacterium tuberculosis]|nr:Uncharacterised protein [Mycobacterium tuberculosis]